MTKRKKCSLNGFKFTFSKKLICLAFAISKKKIKKKILTNYQTLRMNSKDMFTPICPYPMSMYTVHTHHILTTMPFTIQKNIKKMIWNEAEYSSQRWQKTYTDNEVKQPKIQYVFQGGREQICVRLSNLKYQTTTDSFDQ